MQREFYPNAQNLTHHWIWQLWSAITNLYDNSTNQPSFIFLLIVPDNPKLTRLIKRPHTTGYPTQLVVGQTSFYAKMVLAKFGVYCKIRTPGSDPWKIGLANFCRRGPRKKDKKHNPYGPTGRNWRDSLWKHCENLAVHIIIKTSQISGTCLQCVWQRSEMKF